MERRGERNRNFGDTSERTGFKGGQCTPFADPQNQLSMKLMILKKYLKDWILDEELKNLLTSLVASEGTRVRDLSKCLS